MGELRTITVSLPSEMVKEVERLGNIEGTERAISGSSEALHKEEKVGGHQGVWGQEGLGTWD